jgi:hypothetical protein
MEINKNEIEKILKQLSSMDLEEDFENKSMDVAQKVSNKMRVALIENMSNNPEFQVEPKFIKHLAIFISVRQIKGI